MFTPEEDLEEAICMARYDSFEKGPEMAARRRLKELRKSKRAADEGSGPQITPAQEAAFRLLTSRSAQDASVLRQAGGPEPNC